MGLSWTAAFDLSGFQALPRPPAPLKRRQAIFKHPREAAAAARLKRQAEHGPGVAGTVPDCVEGFGGSVFRHADIGPVSGRVGLRCPHVNPHGPRYGRGLHVGPGEGGNLAAAQAGLEGEPDQGGVFRPAPGRHFRRLDPASPPARPGRDGLHPDDLVIGDRPGLPPSPFTAFFADPRQCPARDFAHRGSGPGDFGAELDRGHHQRDRGRSGPGGVQPGDVIGHRGIGLAVDRNRGVQLPERGGVGCSGVVGDAGGDQLASIVADGGDRRDRRAFDG